MDTDLLIVVSDFGSGGSQRAISLICNHWAKKGKAVKIITFSDVKNDFYKLNNNIERISIDSCQSTSTIIEKITGNIRRIYLLREAIVKSNPPIVLSFIGATNILVIISSFNLKCKTIISERNDPGRQSLGKVWDFLRKRLYRYADVVTANSINALSEMEKFVPKSKLVFTPNALPDEVTSVSPKMEKEILYVGRLHKQKMHENIIEAYKNIAFLYPDWKLTIVGEGPNRGTLEGLIRKYNLEKFIILEGEVLDIEKYYRRSSIFILISQYEGTANSVIEAVSHGLPVIINKKISGCLDWVVDGVSGYILDDESIITIDKHLSSLMKDSVLRKEFSRKSLDIYKKKKSDDDAILIWEEIFGWH